MMNWFDWAGSSPWTIHHRAAAYRVAVTGMLFVALTGCEIRVSTVTTPPSNPNPANGANSTSSGATQADANAESGEPTEPATKDATAEKTPTTGADPAVGGAPAGADTAAGKPKELLPIESTSRRALRSADGVDVITFDDLNIGMQQDMVYRDFLLTDRVKELEGRRVRLIGYMHGGQSQLKDIKEFVLLRNTECKFGPGGLADHLVRVLLKADVGANYSTNAIQVEGVLKIAPFQGPDGNTWSVYDLAGDQVKEIRK